MPEPTTTSFAILGQLALRSWTTYELATQMRRNLHFFWPSAESSIYAHVKQLEAAGLARSVRTYTGRRPRTTYSITRKGRAALRAWLAGPPAESLSESEPVLRAFVASQGTLADLLRSIEAVRSQAEGMREVGRTVAAEYIDGTAEFATEMHLRALVFDFLWRQSEAMLSWADAARAEVARWRDLSLSDDKRRRALVTFTRTGSSRGRV